MTDEEAARRYAVAVAELLAGPVLQQPSKDKAKRFLMLALDHLA